MKLKVFVLVLGLQTTWIPHLLHRRYEGIQP